MDKFRNGISFKEKSIAANAGPQRVSGLMVAVKFVDCTGMRKRTLILTGLLLAATGIYAQWKGHTAAFTPAAAARYQNCTDKKQLQTFWLITPQPDTLKIIARNHSIPITILHHYTKINLAVVHTSWQAIDSLLLNTAVPLLIDIPRVPREELALPAYDNSLNAINAVHYRYPALNGNGLVVSIKEHQFDSSDIDLKGRNIATPLASPVMMPHATVMATFIAGAGNSFYTGKGPAWQAQLSSSDFASLLPDSDDDYARYRISVQNHSYGTDIENYYGADAAAYDATVQTLPHLLHVFSAGNAGDRAPTTGTYGGLDSFANLTGSFKMAKNILTVGAVDSFGTVGMLSSGGPAYDGRMKPELTAFGQGGTSEAAALVSGIALLVQQAYREVNNHTLPPAALVKAVLVAGATDAGTPGPDYRYGFGIVNGEKAIATAMNNRYFIDSAGNGTAKSFSFTLPAGMRRLQVALCWSDPPAAVNATRALVNDLDLQLHLPSNNQHWLPWVRSSYPHRDSLNLPARRGRDSLNNVEQITVAYPPAGEYVVQVTGTAVSGTQPFSIAWHADTADQFHWRFPLAKDQLLSNGRNLLRWSSTFQDDDTGALHYSVDGGNEWRLLADNIRLSNGHWLWQSPDTVCTLLFRMSIRGQQYFSDTCTLSYPPDLRVGFDCEDSLLLYWKPVPGARGYRLWQLGTQYMEPAMTVTDTVLILPHPGDHNRYYAITPEFNAALEGIRSYAVDYTLQGVGCYIANFLADAIDNGHVRTLLQMGTLHGVREVRFEKYINGSFVPVHTVAAGSALAFTYTDQQTVTGRNMYRAGVVLQNGMVLYSEPASVYIVHEQGYLVFPNPLPAGAMLQIHTTGLEPKEVMLFNMIGQKVLHQRINQLVAPIHTNRLQPGAYYLDIRKNGVTDYSAAIIIQ